MRRFNLFEDGDQTNNINLLRISVFFNLWIIRNQSIKSLSLLNCLSFHKEDEIKFKYPHKNNSYSASANILFFL